MPDHHVENVSRNGASGFLRTALCMFAISALVPIDALPAESQAPVSVPTTGLRVLKISAGPSGADKNGVFTLSEERSIFSRTTDRELIVFFQWEGSLGAHKLVAQWRSPDGNVSATSTMDYVAKDRRFGAYWPLYLSSSIALGTWSVEATVDGQPAGRYSLIPFSSVRSPDIPRETTLGDLQAAGSVALPLSGDEHVVSGGFARGILRSPAPRPSAQRDDFAIEDKVFVTFVNWTPIERLRGTTQLVLYDASNQRVIQSETKKSDFRKGEFVLAYWEFPFHAWPGFIAPRRCSTGGLRGAALCASLNKSSASGRAARPEF